MTPTDTSDVTTLEDLIHAQMLTRQHQTIFEIPDREIGTASPRRLARAWSAADDTALTAAVERHLAEHRFLDWEAIAKGFSDRTPGSVEVRYYTLRSPSRRPQCVDHRRPSAAAALTVRRPCLRCRSPFESMDRKRNWICEPCKRSLGENPFAEARIERQAA
jgi:hypothetical protein